MPPLDTRASRTCCTAWRTSWWEGGSKNSPKILLAILACLRTTRCACASQAAADPASPCVEVSAVLLHDVASGLRTAQADLTARGGKVRAQHTQTSNVSERAACAHGPPRMQPPHVHVPLHHGMLNCPLTRSAAPPPPCQEKTPEIVKPSAWATRELR